MTASPVHAAIRRYIKRHGLTIGDLAAQVRGARGRPMRRERLSRALGGGARLTEAEWVSLLAALGILEDIERTLVRRIDRL